MTKFLADLLKRIEEVSLQDVADLEACLGPVNPNLGETEVAVIKDVFIKKALTLLAMIQEEMKISLRESSEKNQQNQAGALRAVFPKTSKTKGFLVNYVHLNESREMLLRVVSSSVRHENPHIGIGDLAIRSGWRVVFNQHMSMEMLDLVTQQKSSSGN